MRGGQQGSPVSLPPALPPAYLKMGVQTRKAERVTRACPAPLPDDASGRRGEPGLKGPRRGFAHWAPSGLAPSQKGAGAGGRRHSPLGAALLYCPSPDGSSDGSASILPPAVSTAHPSGVCLLALARETKHHQASSQARSPRWAKEKQTRQVSLCVPELPAQRGGPSALV